LAFGEHLTYGVRRCFLAYAWRHFELFMAQFTLHSCIVVGAELHLFFDDVFYGAGLL
jgi:hypothetical protein